MIIIRWVLPISMLVCSLFYAAELCLGWWSPLVSGLLAGLLYVLWFIFWAIERSERDEMAVAYLVASSDTVAREDQGSEDVA